MAKENKTAMKIKTVLYLNNDAGASDNLPGLSLRINLAQLHSKEHNTQSKSI